MAWSMARVDGKWRTACAHHYRRAQAATEKLDYVMLDRIRDEGLTRSQVMDMVSWLSDVYGPRLTGGPGIMQASDWTLKKFGEWGLVNAHRLMRAWLSE
jgi:hypothetical protein